eukprot:gnl/Dysnectes_brevis/3338_a4194_1134.p1 GENE.gnl/Dysnectes_brevis/3338_a4194_1134~~gnl/Dysnectes_brevis/3338_a4194_1134.p1  ORF type:complete len:208 (-),score=60.85 gnl/Dysnectes_brevis/3338_a4194_1134:35-658(-)
MIFTYIARLDDSLPLVSFDHGKSFRNTAILQDFTKHLNASSPTNRSVRIEADILHYIIEDGVVYSVVTSSQFHSTHAFTYLQDVQHQFNAKYAARLSTTASPYSFMDFEAAISTVAREHSSRSSLRQLSAEANDVRQHMLASVRDIVGRGTKLSEVEAQSERLLAGTREFMDSAKELDMQALWRQYGTPAMIVGGLLFFVLLRYWLF